MLETILLVSSLPACLLDQRFLSSVLCFSHCSAQKPSEHGLNYKLETKLLPWMIYYPCLWKHHGRFATLAFGNKVCSSL